MPSVSKSGQFRSSLCYVQFLACVLCNLLAVLCAFVLHVLHVAFRAMNLALRARVARFARFMHRRIQSRHNVRTSLLSARVPSVLTCLWLGVLFGYPLSRRTEGAYEEDEDVGDEAILFLALDYTQSRPSGHCSCPLVLAACGTTISGMKRVGHASSVRPAP